MDKTARVYDLRITVEPLAEGGDYAYMATSPDLEGLIVVGDTVEEVLALTPSVASALIASLREAGDPLPASLRELPTAPFQARVTVAA